MLRETIQSIGKFEGVQSSIQFDSYGDVVREHFPFTITEGQFRPVELE